MRGKLQHTVINPLERERAHASEQGTDPNLSRRRRKKRRWKGSLASLLGYMMKGEAKERRRRDTADNTEKWCWRQEVQPNAEFYDATPSKLIRLKPTSFYSEDDTIYISQRYLLTGHEVGEGHGHLLTSTNLFSELVHWTVVVLYLKQVWHQVDSPPSSRLL